MCSTALYSTSKTIILYKHSKPYLCRRAHSNRYPLVSLLSPVLLMDQSLIHVGRDSNPGTILCLLWPTIYL